MQNAPNVGLFVELGFEYLGEDHSVTKVEFRSFCTRFNLYALSLVVIAAGCVKCSICRILSICPLVLIPTLLLYSTLLGIRNLIYDGFERVLVCEIVLHILLNNLIFGAFYALYALNHTEFVHQGVQ